jgi:hypothetical protein
MSNPRLAAWLGACASLLSFNLSARTVEIPFDPANFDPGAAIDNPYWPQLPETVSVYTSETDEGCAVNEVSVPGTLKSGFEGPYAAIQAWVVVDREWLDPTCTGNYALVEDTHDWYAQDRDGNIWYFGEATVAYDDEDECPSTEGSWSAGTDGAVAGIIMLAEPASGLRYRQEFLEGEAEDWARVLRTNARVDIEFGEFSGCLVTKEWTPLSPGAVEHKYYCPAGGGLMLIEELGGGPKVRVEFVGSERPPGTYAPAGVCPAD